MSSYNKLIILNVGWYFKKWKYNLDGGYIDIMWRWSSATNIGFSLSQSLYTSDK